MNDRHDTEEALRASEERFRALTEISSDWFWETDRSHRFTFLSVETTIEYKIKRADVIGKTRQELMPDAMTPQEWAAHDEILAARKPFQRMLTRTFNRRTGEVSGFFSLTGQPMFDAHGEFLGYRGIGRDVTSIKMAERQLAANEARYRLITQNMRDIIVLMQCDGETIYLSPSFSRVTGHDIETSIREDAGSFFHPEDYVWVEREFARCAIGERDGLQPALTYRFRHAEGHYIWLEGQLHLVRDDSGLPSHIQISARDVTARRLAEISVAAKTLELKEANSALENEVRSRQELERNILITIEKELEQVGLELHDELGQDLTGIALLTKTLAQKLIGKGPVEAALASRISTLVNRTIGHTRMIAHGLSPYIWGQEGLVAALRQLASDINSLDAVKCDTRIPKAVTISDELVARTLYRIAQEAVNNALKHSKAGKIRIALTRTSRGVELVVSDDGIGHPLAESETGEPLRFHSIRHRCRAIDASLSIGDGTLGGTMVRVTWREAKPVKVQRQPITKNGSAS
ncbi:MAG: PAS domain S-box protein [Betaproteobacteria bacterium]